VSPRREAEDDDDDDEGETSPVALRHGSGAEAEGLETLRQHRRPYKKLRKLQDQQVEQPARGHRAARRPRSAAYKKLRDEIVTAT
jgi:hypothetical protein